MTDAAVDPQRPRPAGGGQRVRGGSVAELLVMPAAAAAAVVCSATALAGVLSGLSWLAYVVVPTMVVAATGTALRGLRAPRASIAFGQLAVLSCLSVALFTNSGLLLVLPGPAALHDLFAVLGQSLSEVRNDVPPVNPDQPILCLIVVSIGLVAVAVDTLAATARVPATAGLVLLCVYAVPASLAGTMLPWWSFVIGASAFTLLLALDGAARQQRWRGKLGTGGPATRAAPAAVAVTTVSLVLALLVGASFTIVGTAGRLPGGSGDNAAAAGRLGISPFTVLRGMLQGNGNTELFDVRGLPASASYLRALTLATYRPNDGWVVGSAMAPGVPANVPLPIPPGVRVDDATTTIEIQPVNWQDVWLPVFGVPRGLRGVPTNYHYDENSGIVYSQRPQHPGPYVEQAIMGQPTAAALRSAGSNYDQIDAPKYEQIDQVNPQVRQLALQLTANAGTEFDKALAIYQYFTSPSNGFTYSTQTAPATSSDALVDFLFHGKTGFCEQYASAMAVMLRTIGIPVRVAIGFTDGTASASGDQRVITSQDAHAWVEVFFPGYGWVPFDPTPLTDGRTRTPDYLVTGDNSANSLGTAGRSNPAKESGQGTEASKPAGPSASSTGSSRKPTTSGQPGGASTWRWWLLGALVLLASVGTVLAVVTRPGRPALRWYGGGKLDAWLRAWRRPWKLLVGAAWVVAAVLAATWVSAWLALLVVLFALAATPAAIRLLRRRERVAAVMAGGPDAAPAAWAEVLAESWDRGTAIADTDTLRVAAARLAREHGMDEEGGQGLRALVSAVERAWYSAPTTGYVTRGQADATLMEAFEGVCASLRRNAPLTLRARWLPRSVLRPRRSQPSPDVNADEPAPALRTR